MLISGIIEIILGLAALAYSIIKMIIMMKADNNTEITKYDNDYDDFTIVNSQEYNTLDQEQRTRCFKGKTSGSQMVSSNPKIGKIFLLGFSSCWTLIGTGVFSIAIYITGLNFIVGLLYFLFVGLPIIFFVYGWFISFKNENIGVGNN